MIALISFTLGFIFGLALSQRRWKKVEDQRAKNKMCEEIDLRATPDNYLSKVQLMKKQYIEAKWQESVKLINKKKMDYQNE